LCKVSVGFKEKVGNAALVKWPVGVKASGGAGIAGTIEQIPGAISCVELSYALMNKLKFGKVKNRDGDYILGSLEGVTAAAEATLKDSPANLRFSLTDARGKDAYPISGGGWAVIFRKQPRAKGERVVEFLRYVLREGQEYNMDLHYGRLPKQFADRANEMLNEVTFEE
jgi:phosphate transport system substrate-binding protein